MMTTLHKIVTPYAEETPSEPGCYRLEDIQRATPMTRDADITMAQPYVFHVISATTPISDRFVMFRKPVVR